MDQIDKAGVLSYFSQLVNDNPDMSAAVAAIETLLHFIETNKFETLAGMRAKLRDAISVLTQTDSSVTSISSGCELFLRFITLASLDQPKNIEFLRQCYDWLRTVGDNFQECQKILSERGKLFLQKVATSRHKIAKLAHPFIRDGATILVHSYSRVVQQVLKEAASAKKRFNVYVTESGPNQSGIRTYNELTACSIPTTVVLDAAVAYVMEKVDLVLLGAEGVVESGGIINKIGTYNIAIAAKTMNKPTYVVAESFKFHRFYPLNQRDLPNHFKYHATTMKESVDLSKEHPLVDYTPPAYITLLFTDLGVLTPSAVSDELIKLYC